MEIPTSSCAIIPSDFSQSMADRQRENWTPGKMRHVIKALDGAPVIITTDRTTGHTLFNVRLLGLTETVNSGQCVVLQGEGPSWPRPVAYRLLNCSVIIPLASPERSDHKWNALDSYREESSATIQRAKRERPECDYGKWTAVPGRHEVSWHYEPQSFTDGKNAAFRGSADYSPENRGKPTFAYGSYRLDELDGEQTYSGKPYKIAKLAPVA